MHEYLLSLLGGILIGLSASVMLGGIGKIAGVSGIFMGMFTNPDNSGNWRYGFVGGLLTGGLVFLVFRPQALIYNLDHFGFGHAIVAGLLVGFGTRLGSGCTSGHGVCGLSRLSKRSFVATITFIIAGVVTVAIRGML